MTTIASKRLVAMSGAILLLFVVAHMLGNLEFLRGPRALDSYAAWLRTIGSPVLGTGWFLWIQRTVLATCAGVHVVLGMRLAVRNHAARPIAYTKTSRRTLALAARTMRPGGAAILLFVVYHLLDLSAGVLHPDYVAGAVHHNIVAGFARWYAVAVYAAATAALALHISHGAWSMLQTLGVNAPRSLRVAAHTLAVLVGAGFLAVPVAAGAR